MKVMPIFGTRPEAVKMCPVVKALAGREGVETVICVSGQHREMLTEVLSAFGVAPDYDLAVMKEGQTLVSLTAAVLRGVDALLRRERPDAVLVHGDTTTALAASLAAFYLRIPVGHVEAGLRTYDMYAPYPEEFNRRAIALTAALHFAPTEGAKRNLLAEGVGKDKIFVTGNTVLDALRTTVRADYSHPDLAFARGRRLLLLTAHRRESLGEPMAAAFRAIRRVVEEHTEVCLLYPVHKNPAVRRLAAEAFDGCPRVRLTEPYAPFDFHNILARAALVLTDSGGIQEEAPALGIPVLLLRDRTERPEGVAVGLVRPVGTEEERVYHALRELLEDTALYASMRQRSDLYGDGHAAVRIADILCSHIA